MSSKTPIEIVKQNEIRAVMDLMKLGVQSMLAYLFAVIISAIQGQPVSWGAYAIFILAGLTGLTLLTRKYKYLGRELDNIECGRHV